MSDKGMPEKAPELEEYETKVMMLSSIEHELLVRNFSKYVTVTRVGKREYKIRAKQYVGDIVLGKRLISIKPKISTLNFYYMLNKTYDLKPFMEQSTQYVKERSVFEIILEQFLNLVEDLSRKGISRSYYEVQENLPFVKGRIIVSENFRRNIALQQLNFCRYADFGADNIENRVIKYTLYYLFTSRLPREDLRIAIKGLFHHFESVSYSTISSSAFPAISYTRLNKHYEPIISMCKLLLQNMTINLEYHDETSFSSFMIDMNVLFEHFVFTLLHDSLVERAWTIRGGGRKESSYSDIENATEIIPDVTMRGGRNLLVIDAKYKTEVLAHKADLNQIWIYCIALGSRIGVLVYPKHEVDDTLVLTHTLRGNGTKVFVRTIDLQKSNLIQFEKECENFVSDIIELSDAHTDSSN
jgi:5-methylcytosine-specific restriction enzyme subunit McrC